MKKLYLNKNYKFINENLAIQIIIFMMYKTRAGNYCFLVGIKIE